MAPVKAPNERAVPFLLGKLLPQFHNLGIGHRRSVRGTSTPAFWKSSLLTQMVQSGDQSLTMPQILPLPMSRGLLPI